MTKKQLHRCEERYDSTQCGPAIDYCYEERDGTLWAGNGEYESMVNYCPFCGRKARKPAETTEGGTTWASSKCLDDNGESEP